MTSWGPENAESEEYLSDIIIERNVFQAAHKVAVQSRGASRVTVRNNVFLDVREAVSTGQPGVGNSGTWANWTIVNNSVLNTVGGDFAFVKASEPMSNVRIYNNAVNAAACTGGASVRMVALPATPRAQITEGNNVYYAPSQASGALFESAEGTYTLAAWGVATDLLADPQFALYAQTLTIPNTSPGSSQGVASPEVAEDIMGTPRPLSSPCDIGAYEAVN
jgi:hypothetical protein